MLLTKHDRLTKLGKEVRDSQEVIDLCAQKWTNDGLEYLKEVSLQGSRIKQARDESEHGDFLRWLATYFSKSERTAYRYIEVSEKLPRVANLDGVNSIRQVLGAMTGEEGGKAKKPTSDQPALRIALPDFDKLSAAWNQLDESKKEKLKAWLNDELPKFIELKEQMNKTVEAESVRVE